MSFVPILDLSNFEVATSQHQQLGPDVRNILFTSALQAPKMPDISNLKVRQAPPADDVETSESSSSEEEEINPQPLVIPDACLACGKERVTHLTVPCRHPCLCRACAMKMATGGKCKVLQPSPSLFFAPILLIWVFWGFGLTLGRYVRGCLSN